MAFWWRQTRGTGLWGQSAAFSFTSRTINVHVWENRRHSGNKMFFYPAKYRAAHGRWQGLQKLESPWKRMAHWERWEIAVPFGNKQAEKSKVICWTCARVNRMERRLHCIYREAKPPVILSRNKWHQSTGKVFLLPLDWWALLFVLQEAFIFFLSGKPRSDNHTFLCPRRRAD